MISPELLEKALGIAVEAHQGQRDKNDAPYIMHPIRVMGRVRTTPEKIVAILHDVVEDTDWTLERLKKEGFPQEILEAVDCLTKREGEAYEDFVDRAASNPISRPVKLADLEDNMDVRRLKSVAEKDRERLERYRRAWEKLTGE